MDGGQIGAGLDARRPCRASADRDGGNGFPMRRNSMCKKHEGVRVRGLPGVIWLIFAKGISWRVMRDKAEKAV